MEYNMINVGAITKSIGGFFVNLFEDIFTSGQAKTIEGNIEAFVKTDIGELALDAVAYVNTKMPGSPSADKQAAARDKLVSDAKASGKDLSSLATSTLNWFVETALQALLAKAGAAGLTE
ncbi:MAG TPA: hypothetical protein VIY48_00800 [Candidatus Paceibacterota bacterium]